MNKVFVCVLLVCVILAPLAFSQQAHKVDPNVPHCDGRFMVAAENGASVLVSACARVMIKNKLPDKIEIELSFFGKGKNPFLGRKFCTVRLAQKNRLWTVIQGDLKLQKIIDNDKKTTKYQISLKDGKNFKLVERFLAKGKKVLRVKINRKKVSVHSTYGKVEAKILAAVASKVDVLCGALDKAYPEFLPNVSADLKPSFKIQHDYFTKRDKPAVNDAIVFLYNEDIAAIYPIKK